MSDTLVPWLIGLGIVAVIIRVAYKTGYDQGRKDVLDPPHLRPLTEGQKTNLLMKQTLPRWRRVAGRAAIVVGGLMFWVLMGVAVRYGGGSGWAFLGAGVLSLVLLMAGFWACEQLWRPFRQAQEEERRRKRANPMD